MAKQLKITQIKSLIGSLPKHKRTMQAIGFRHHQQTLIRDDSAQLRGMLNQIQHLVAVEETGAAPKKTKTRSKAKAAGAKASPKAKAAGRSAKAGPKVEARAKANETKAAEETE